MRGQLKVILTRSNATWVDLLFYGLVCVEVNLSRSTVLALSCTAFSDGKSQIVLEIDR